MNRSASRSKAVSPFRDYYDALLTLKEQEQTALAEIHAEDPRLLLRRFRQSVTALETEPTSEEPESFYPRGRIDPSSLPSKPVVQIRSTIQFAREICDGRPRPVAGKEELGFRYVDREISPLRTTKPGTKPARRSLDLLLANEHDRMAIFAELKIRGDKLPYFALVQALMLTSELLVQAQRARLKKDYQRDLVWPERGPFADVYVIAFDPPARGTYRERSFHATEQIAEHLTKDEVVAKYIRRISYLDALPEEGTLTFKSRFSFPGAHQATGLA